MKHNKTSNIPTIAAYVVGKIFNLKIKNNKTNVATTCIPNITGHDITFLSFSIYVPSLYFSKLDI